MGGPQSLDQEKGKEGKKDINAPLAAKVAEIKKAAPHLPVAGPIAEGLLLAKETAVEEVRGELMELRTTVTGTEGLAETIKGSATKMQTAATDAKAAAESAKGASDVAAASAKAVGEKIDSLTVTDGEGKEHKGVEALAVVGQMATGIPNKVTEAVEGLTTATVTRESGRTEVLKGTALMRYLVETAENARRSAGKALNGGKQVASALDNSVKEALTVVLATIAATVTKAGLPEPTDEEVEAEKANVMAALEEGGATVPDSAFVKNLVHVVSTISATLTKSGLEEATDAEVEAEKANVGAALAETN